MKRVTQQTLVAFTSALLFTALAALHAAQAAGSLTVTARSLPPKE